MKHIYIITHVNGAIYISYPLHIFSCFIWKIYVACITHVNKLSLSPQVNHYAWSIIHPTQARTCQWGALALAPFRAHALPVHPSCTKSTRIVYIRICHAWRIIYHTHPRHARSCARGALMLAPIRAHALPQSVHFAAEGAWTRIYYTRWTLCHMNLKLSIYRSMYLPVCPSTYLIIYIHVYPDMHICIYVHVYMYVYGERYIYIREYTSNTSPHLWTRRSGRRAGAGAISRACPPARRPSRGRRRAASPASSPETPRPLPYTDSFV